MWDVIVITTYLFISILLLYIPLLPDLKIMGEQDTKRPEMAQKFYRFWVLSGKATHRKKSATNR